jgi:hypothetical protein
MCPVQHSFQDRTVSLYSFKTFYILLTVSNINTYCSSDNVDTVYLVQYNSEFHHQHQRSLYLVSGHDVLHVCTGYKVHCTTELRHTSILEIVRNSTHQHNKFLNRMADTMMPRMLIFPPGTPCVIPEENIRYSRNSKTDQTGIM